MEDAATWLGFTLALPLLLAALLILAFIRGLETNSNSIHKNLVFCVLLAEAVYFTALKARRSLVMHEVWADFFSPLFVKYMELNKLLFFIDDFLFFSLLAR